MAKCPSVGINWESASGLAVTLTFDLLTSECNQFITVPNCTKVATLAKFTQVVYKISCQQTFSR